MSSILRALKKLEQDRPPKAYPRIWVRNENDARGLRNWLIGSAAVVLFAGGGVAAYYTLGARSTDTMSDPAARQAKSIEPSAPKAVASAQVEAAEAQTPDIKSAANAKQPPPVGQKERSVEKKQRPPVVIKKQPVPMATGPVVESVVPTAPVSAKPPSGKSQASAKSRTLQTPTKLSPEPSSQAASTNPKKAPVEQQVADDRAANVAAPQTLPATLLTDSSLKIQAISWSQTPANRIAVVNSQIVREGGSIDGYRVEQINSDDLILSKGGIDWILKFVHQ